MKTGTKRVVVVLMVAVFHFGLSFGMLIWAMGIPMRDNDYETPHLTAREKIIVTAAAAVNLPLVTMRNMDTFSFPDGNWRYLLFAADSILWATAIVLLLPRLLCKSESNECRTGKFRIRGYRVTSRQATDEDSESGWI